MSHHLGLGFIFTTKSVYAIPYSLPYLPYSNPPTPHTLITMLYFDTSLNTFLINKDKSFEDRNNLNNLQKEKAQKKIQKRKRILVDPNFARPKFRQTQISPDPNFARPKFRQTQISPDPNFARPSLYNQT